MEQKPSMLLMIRQRYQNLTYGEKRVADYILTHSDSISKMHIQDLAIAAGVANSAVVRFCKAIGLSGYAELKYKFLEETSKKEEPLLLPAIKRGDKAKDIFNKTFTSNINSLYETIRQIDMEQVDKAVSLLHKARHILLLGTGSSESVVTNAAYHIYQFGYQVTTAVSGVMMRTMALNLGPEDVGIGISYSGHTHDTVESLYVAHHSGAATIAVTSYTDSPLCESADIILYAPPGDIPYMTDDAVVASRTSHNCILDSLVITLACQDYDESISKIYARNTIIFPSIRD